MQQMMTQLIQTTAKGFNTLKKKLTKRTSLEQIYVPTFDPDYRTDTVKVWCLHIDELKTEYELMEK